MKCKLSSNQTRDKLTMKLLEGKECPMCKCFKAIENGNMFLANYDDLVICVEKAENDFIMGTYSAKERNKVKALMTNEQLKEFLYSMDSEMKDIAIYAEIVSPPKCLMDNRECLGDMFMALHNKNGNYNGYQVRKLGQ